MFENWRADRIDHIARHAVTPEEIIETMFDDPSGILLRVGPAERNPEETMYRYLGRTGSGRYLLVVLLYLGEGVAMPVTARDMTHGERSRFDERHPRSQ
ncbi:MAG: BrnT family toxin [Chloroflexota bacterium]